MPNEIATVDVYVFYFDVSGFVDQYLQHGADALNRLRQFQRAARAAFEFGRDHSYVATLYDNVWARINVNEPGASSLLLNFAGDTMRAAQMHGFDHFFGCITRGIHDFDPHDRMLIGKETLEDLTQQHLDVMSEPHIRAASADKWSKVDAFPKDCVWVCGDVMDLDLLPVLYPDSTYEPFEDAFDLALVRRPDGSSWRFSPSQFRAIRPRSASG